MRRLFVMLFLFMTGACAHEQPPQQTNLTANAQMSIVSNAQYAMKTLPEGPRMQATTPCAQGVDNILTHLENLMVESGHMSPDQVPSYTSAATSHK